MRNFLSLLLVFVFAQLMAQTTPVVLLSEDFESCGSLPSGWSVNVNGNQDALWYIGYPLNSNSDSSTIDGSCMVIIDDDGTGDNTPAFVWEMASPAFDASGYTRVSVTADVHFRDFNDTQESFSIYASDGVEEKLLLRLADQQSTGTQFSEYKTVRFDLAFGFLRPNVRLIFRYDDGNGGWAWWAGFDNVRVEASGAGRQLVLAEDFNTCSLPQGWTSEILTGNDAWQFGIPTNPKTSGAPSIDGTCMAYFDDDILGDSAAPSKVRLYSPWFDGTEYARFFVDFDFIHRYWSEISTLYVQHGDGSEFTVDRATSDVGGPNFGDFVPLSLDISAFRSPQMRLCFEYDDGGQWAWWAGFDNVKVTANGLAIDLCKNAVTLSTLELCTYTNNRLSIFDGPATNCGKKDVGGVWYQWPADFSGWAAIETNSNFNEIVSIFGGTCTNLQSILCENRDEHGFTGENTRFQAVEGTLYFFRVSGEAGAFGRDRGEICVAVKPTSAPPTSLPAENCAAARLITLGQPCPILSNRQTKTDNPQPSHADWARADVWYRFVAPAAGAPNELLELDFQGDFSPVISVYSGTCANLTEVAAQVYGQKTELRTWTPGATYFVQIAGLFATIEGDICLSVQKKTLNTPQNDDCIVATPLVLGGNCLAQNNTGAATQSSYVPPCAVSSGYDLWFSFIAPASGLVGVETGATFEHSATIWEGNCNNLQAVQCNPNPLPCDGYFFVGELNPGQRYFLQIASTSARADMERGPLCIKIVNGALPLDYVPMSLAVQAVCTDIGFAVLDIESVGGQQPITIQDPSSGLALASGSSYWVAATDARGCVRSIEGIVPECTTLPCSVIGTLQVQQPSCFGGTDGSISLSPEGGNPPYSVAWSVAGASGMNLSGLSSGVYTLTVSDSEGCSWTASRVLTAPDAITATAVSVVEPNQGQSNGEIITAITGGNAGYAYSWSRNGAVLSNTKDLMNVPAGIYTLIITDAKGCTGELVVTLNASTSAFVAADEIGAHIHPNPSTGRATLYLKLPAPADILFSLHDASGRELKTWKEKNIGQNHALPLDFTELPNGVYQVKMRLGDRVVVRKVVVTAL